MTMGMGAYAGRTVATKVVATDGTGDYTDIQTAIDSLTAIGGVVYIKEGTYTVSTTISITVSNVTLVGAGAATIIKLANAANTRNLRVGDGAAAISGVVISEIQFDGNRANNASNLPVVHVSANTADCKVERCWVIEGDDDGILIDASTTRTHVINNVVYNNDDNGINCAGATNGTIIQNNFSYSNGGAGIRCVLAGGYTLIEGNLCAGNTEYGIEAQAARTNIIGNFCIANTLDGIYTYSDHHSVIGNWCAYNNRNGIYVNAGDFCIISNNYVYNSSYNNDNTSSEIQIGDYATYNIVSNNQCHADDPTYQAKYGILETATGCDYNLVHANIVAGQQTDGILTAGASTVVTDNIDAV